MGDRPDLPERKAIKDALRACGLSDRQVRALLAKGWAALVGETKAENVELQERLAELIGRMTG